MNAESAKAVRGWLKEIAWMEGVTPVEYADARGDIVLKVVFPLGELDFLTAGVSTWGVGTYPLTFGTDDPFAEIMDDGEYAIAFLA